MKTENNRRMTRDQCKQKTRQNKKPNAIQTTMTINHKKNKSATKLLKQQKMTRDECKQNMTKQKNQMPYKQQ